MNGIDTTYNPIALPGTKIDATPLITPYGVAAIIFAGYSLLFGAAAYKALGAVKGTHIRHTTICVYGPRLPKPQSEVIGENLFFSKIFVVFLSALSLSSALAAIYLAF